MPYIYERKDWPSFRWDSAELLEPLSGLRLLQGRLVGMAESLREDERLELLRAALSEEIVASFGIEGVRLDESMCAAEVGRMLGVEGCRAGSGDHRLEGVVQAYSDASLRFASHVNEERLFGWHAALFPSGRSSRVPIDVAVWRGDREGPMRIMSGSGRNMKVHFKAPPASALPQETERLLRWIEGEGGGDAVLRAGIAHLWFATLHPFDDGNGRLARLLTLLMLARSQGTAPLFAPSAEILWRRSEYYEALQEAQAGNMDVTPWLRWFVSALTASVREGLSRAESAAARASLLLRLAELPLTVRQRKGVCALLNKSEITNAAWVEAVGGSHDSALRDLSDLLKQGVLVRARSAGRGASYRLSVAPDGGR